MFSLSNFYMYTNSKYNATYRKNVYWISAFTTVNDVNINQSMLHSIIFLGAADGNIEDNGQFNLTHYTTTSLSGSIDVNIILYAYDNNATVI